MTRTTNARLAGVASLFYIVVGISNEILMHRAISGEGTTATLTHIAEHSTDVRVSILLKLGECFSAFVLAVALYRITRDEDHELALFGLICRAAEGLFIASLIPNDLALLWVSNAQRSANAPDASITTAIGAFLLMPGFPTGAIFFAAGSVIFSYLLLRGRMVPTALARLGLYSAVLLTVGLPLQLAGFLTGPLAAYQWIPSMIFAPVLGLWLLFKGVTDTPGR